MAELYNQEVLDGHREALAALRELLAAEKDPLERRKLANAVLRARPVKTAEPEQTWKRPAPRPPLLDDDDGEFDRDEREAQAVVDRVLASPDPGAALRELRALMHGAMDAAISPSTPESS